MFFKNLSPKYYFIQIRNNDFSTSFLKNNFVYFDGVGDNLSLKFGQEPLKLFFLKHNIIHLIYNKINVGQYLRKKYFSKILNFFISNSVANKDLKEEYYIYSQLKMLKNQYGFNFTLIYLPNNPIFINNSICFFTKEDLLIRNQIFNYSKELNISIVDLSGDFENYYNETHQLVWGFHNTIPGVGHLNEKGHEIVADKIATFIEGGFEK